MPADLLIWSPLALPAFLFVITIVVFFHELGHFSMARACGIAVQAFSIGFGPELAGWTDRKGTRWKICLLPVGGYVKFAGDADAASRPDEDELRKMEPSRRASILHFKPLYQRALVVAAGPIANFILGIAIFSLVYMALGKVSEAPIVGDVQPDKAAAEAGFQPDDLIRSVDGQPVATFDDLQRIVTGSGGSTLHIVLMRDGREMTIDAAPRLQDEVDASGQTVQVARLGIERAFDSVGPLEAIGLGAGQTWFIVERTLGYLGQIVIGQARPDQVAGPLGILQLSGAVATFGFLTLLALAAHLSVSIGLINLFPIPVLDGGHLLYYAFEAVLGRPLGERAQEIGFRLGLAFVLSLFLLATFNDLVRFNLF